MTNLTLQPYSTKLAKHQPPDWRHPTENESAGLRKKKKKKRKGGGNLLQTLQPSTAGYSIKKNKKIGPVPEGRPEERESSPHLSMVSARVCSSGAHRDRYTHPPKPNPTFPRYQFTNSHGQPEGGGGKRGGGGFFTAAIPAVHGLEL